MQRRSKSQWEFGELFPTAKTAQEAAPPAPARASGPARTVLSVTELTAQVRRLIEQHVGSVWVTGEVTNLRLQSSGHAYFTLKDAGAQLSCVLFRGEGVAHRELLQDGQKLLLGGDVTVYEARGQYQLIVRALELQGRGALQLAFEQLKRKLQAEGLFAADRKRPLPQYPRRIGIVTSPTGAAIRDVLHVIQRRDPGLEIVLVPCRVQGDGAAEEIAAAIMLLNDAASRLAIDLILVTRGGGSLEDLWAFNEEIVARAIFNSTLPVVSAVGHEIDFTISDFVADVRAATPSAAAEIITEGVYASGEFVSRARDRLRHLCRQLLSANRDQFDHALHRLGQVHPRRRLNEGWQRLDEFRSSLTRCAGQGAGQHRARLKVLVDRLLRVRPDQWLTRRREHTSRNTERLRQLACFRLEQLRNRLSLVNSRLHLLGPEQVLARGYSITSDAVTGALLRTAADSRPGQKLRTRLKVGEIVSRVEPSAGGVEPSSRKKNTRSEDQ